MNNNFSNIYPSDTWSSSYTHTDGQRLIPFLTGAVVSAPFWWATRPFPPYPVPVPLPYPYPFPFFPRFPRRPFYRRPFRPFY
ncbi:MAG TPA: hypothetical protein VIK94_02920 [Bacilli bacterium]